MDDEVYLEDGEEEAEVGALLPPSPLNPYLLVGGAIEAIGVTISTWGGFVQVIGRACVAHYEVAYQKRQVAAEMAMELERIIKE